MLALLPEIVLICLLFLIYIYISVFKNSEYNDSLVQLAATFTVLSALVSYDQNGEFLNHVYIVDSFSQTFKVIISSGYFLLIYMATTLEKNNKISVEYFLNISMATLGLFLTASAGDLFTTLAALELTTLSLYTVLFYKGSFGSASFAGIKYILSSVVLSGLSFYGISLLWGVTGKIFIKELANKKVIPIMIGDSPIIVVSFILILLPVLYKLLLFPFNFSTDEITEKGNTITSSFIITVLVTGSIAALIKIITITGNATGKLTWFLIVISILTILVSSFIIISQRKLSSFITCSVINNSGFILLGVACNNETGLISSVYTVAGFSVVVMAMLYLVRFLEDKSVLLSTDLKGLYKKSPLTAVTLTVSIAGASGLPFTSCFIGKLLILYSAIQKEFYGILAVYIVSSLIFIVYGLGIIKYIFDNDDEGSKIKIDKDIYNFSFKLLLVFFIVATILPGVLPQIFIEYAKRSIIMLLSFGPI